MAPATVYGTQQEVAALASVYTRAGVWINPDPPLEKGTNPTLAQVEQWLNNVSGQMNIALGQSNFIVPFDMDTSPNAYKAISQYVVSLVADLCHYKNSSGRLYTEKVLERGTAMFVILKDMKNWIAESERGLLADGLLQADIPLVRNQIEIRVMGKFPRNDYRGR